MLACLSEVIGGLHAQPGICRATKGFLKANRHFGRNASLLVDQVVESLAANAKGLGSLA